MPLCVAAPARQDKHPINALHRVACCLQGQAVLPARAGGLGGDAVWQGQRWQGRAHDRRGSGAHVRQRKGAGGAGGGKTPTADFTECPNELRD